MNEEMIGQTSRLRRIPSWLTVACMLFGSGAAGQTQPDFSGRWVLVDPVDAATNIPRTLIVQQPIVRTNVYGAPMPPAFLRITIGRHFVDDIRTDTYLIGVEGGVFSGASHAVAPDAPIPQTRFSVHWDSDRLVIETGDYSGPTRESGPYTERVEIWQLDSKGALRVMTTDRGSAIATATTTTTYRRH